MNYKLVVGVLGSGSKGNAIYISDGTTSILVDAGLTGIEIERRLKQSGVSPGNLDAIVVTHEHADHISAIGVLSRRFSIPVYISTQTVNQLKKETGRLHKIVTFISGTEFLINTLTLRPFSLPHDAEDPIGLLVSRDGKKIGIATDLGTPTSLSKEHLKECSLLVLEANHDLKMLEEGPYPWSLKQRIRSRTGHLSNEEAGSLLREIRHTSLEHVILAHLSETNNTPQKAYDEVDRFINPRRTSLHVAEQHQPCKLLYLK
jgi:phosphoribosyl 1,2-cyclic phosphodiesterase